MQVTKDAHFLMDEKARAWTEEKMVEDFSYEMAERLTDLLLQKGLIAKEEAANISQRNKENFHPFYQEILD